MLDQIMLRDFFADKAKHEEAKEQAHRYFRDDKPFTMHRWLRMMRDQVRAADTAMRKGLS